MLTLGARTPWVTAVPIAAGSVLNMGISIMGAPHFGIWAVAGSTVIGNLVTSSLVWHKAGRFLGYGLRDTAMTLVLPLGGGLVSLAVSWALSGVARLHTAANIVVCIAAMFTGLAVAAFLMARRPRETTPASVQSPPGAP
jgi:O-antigen/teichoic acid export membrane protein